MMNRILLVMLGGALGAGARYAIARTAFAQWGGQFPWGTLIVNLTGGLAMGVLAGFASRPGSAQTLWILFIGTGILGGFTTFSAFSLETMTMIERGAIASAFAYVFISVIGSVLLVFTGLFFARSLA